MSQTERPSEFEDPRHRAQFLPRYYPAANGRDGPSADSGERNDRIMLEFLATYYDLNCEYSKLLELRTSPDSAERQAAERECLQAIEKGLIARDQLEDRYASYGITAEPVVDAGFTVNVDFAFGNADSRGRPRSDLVTITAHIPIPLPPDAKFDDFIVDVDGPESFIR